MTATTRWTPTPTTAAEVDAQVTGYYARTAAAMPVTTPRVTTETPLDADALVQVFNSIRAMATGTIEGYQADATPDTKARLRMRLAEYDAQPPMRDLVLLVRRYFNTYRQNDWRLVEWQVAAALRLLATVADALDEDPCANCTRNLRDHDTWQRRECERQHRASFVQHGDPRCLTEDTDGECVCS